MNGVKITGCGKCIVGDDVPGVTVTNDGIQDRLQRRWEEISNVNSIDPDDIGGLQEAAIMYNERYFTNDTWIKKRIGIIERRFADPSITTSDVGAFALQKALECAGLPFEKLERIDLGTVTPDYLYSPPTTAVIAKKIGKRCELPEGWAPLFGADTLAACCSFIATMQNTCNSIAAGTTKNGAAIGADIMSRTVSIDNRNFYVVLGDGGAALILEACAPNEGSFIPGSFTFGYEGEYAERIIARAGGSQMPITHSLLDLSAHMLDMDGREVFEELITMLYSEESPEKSFIGKALMQINKNPSNLNHIFFHQANLRMIKPVEKMLRKNGFKGRVFNNIQKYGNTTSASIPLLLTEAHEEGILNYGENALIVVMGGGYSFGTIYIDKWTVNETCPV